MPIKPNEPYIFTKSGNEVRTVAPADPHRGLPCWLVERTSGASTGKQMIVLERALATELN